MATIYARQSKDRQGDGAAVERQLEECRALAERQGLTVDQELVDNDVSASKGRRPGWEQLLEGIRAGTVDTVIVWATDRLYRRLRDLVELVELAETSRLSIVTVKSGDVDLATPAGRMLAGMLGSAARYEVEQKGARQVSANAQRAREGRWQFSRRPYGYERVDGEVRLVAAEAEVLREGYRRSLAGESAYSIAADWNARGILSHEGRAWSVSQLRERLANPHYAGLVVHQGEIVGTGDHEPIVSRADWEAFVQGAKARAARKTGDNRTKYLLSGIAVCGVCGAQMFARPEYRRKDGERRTRMSYQCTTSWCVSRGLEQVDEVVQAVLVARLSLPDAATLLRPSVDVAPLVAEADTLRSRLDDLAALLAEGALTAAAVREQSERLRARLEVVNAAIGQAQGGGQLPALIGAEDVAARWASLPLSARREVIRTLLTVTIRKQQNPRVFDPADVAIAWRS